MNARDVGVALLLAASLSGCVQADAPVEDAADPWSDAGARVMIRCVVTDQFSEPLGGAVCRFTSGQSTTSKAVAANGSASQAVPAGPAVVVQAEADGWVPRSARVATDIDRTVRFVLLPVADAGPSVPADPADTPVRVWKTPVAVGSDNMNEPLVTVAPDGTIYFSPTRSLFRSTDDGETWTEIAPDLPDALPWTGGGTDTGVSVAPDGTLWWTRFWGYVGPTLGCTSHDRGDSWTCDNLANPGATDRMWILGLSETEGYLSTNQAFAAYTWTYTDSGSQRYEPYAAHDAFGFMGNMVYDDVNDAIWQVHHTGGTQLLLRIDGVGDGRMPHGRDTGVPHSFSLSALAAADGVLWLAGEVRETDGSQRIVAARSKDMGATWEHIPVSVEASSATFATVWAASGGRVALAYYGSDAPGPPDNNGGTWSVYVAETDDGLAEHPLWVESRVADRVHVGNICAGVACAEQGDDPQARYAGDFMGIWVDAWGDVHVGYTEDTSGPGRQSVYVRQVAAGGAT